MTSTFDNESNVADCSKYHHNHFQHHDATAVVREQIAAIRQQEERSYRISDWLVQRRNGDANTNGSSTSLGQLSCSCSSSASTTTSSIMERSSPSSTLNAGYTNPMIEAAVVQESFRGEMIEWAVRVVDHYQLNRQTIEIGISLTDRFVSTSQGQHAAWDREQFQLVFITAFYMALKLQETKLVSSSTIAKFSHGTFTAEQIERMEQRILTALGWHVHPPTTADILHLLMELIPDHILDPPIRITVLELSQLQTDLALPDYRLVCLPATIRAYAALMNALESLQVDDRVLETLGYDLAKAMNIDCNSPMVMETQRILYHCVAFHHHQHHPQSSLLSSSSSSFSSSSSSSVSLSVSMNSTVTSPHHSTWNDPQSHHHNNDNKVAMATSSSSPVIQSVRVSPCTAVSYE